MLKPTPKYSQHRDLHESNPKKLQHYMHACKHKHASHGKKRERRSLTSRKMRRFLGHPTPTPSPPKAREAWARPAK